MFYSGNSQKQYVLLIIIVRNNRSYSGKNQGKIKVKVKENAAPKPM